MLISVHERPLAQWFSRSFEMITVATLLSVLLPLAFGGGGSSLLDVLPPLQRFSWVVLATVATIFTTFGVLADDHKQLRGNMIATAFLFAILGGGAMVHGWPPDVNELATETWYFAYSAIALGVAHRHRKELEAKETLLQAVSRIYRERGSDCE